MKNPAKVILIGLIPIFLFCHFLMKSAQAPSGPEKTLEEFFALNPSIKKLLSVLKTGAAEPFKTKIIEKIMELKPAPEEAVEVLAQKPVEPYAKLAWEIVETGGSLGDRCGVLSSGPEEYQNKAFVSIFGRQLIVEEYIFYLMQLEYQPKYVRQIWDNFMKLNPGKEGFLYAARNATGDFQEMAILQLLYMSRELGLTTSEFSEVLELIKEAKREKTEKKERELIEIMTRKPRSS